MDIGESCNGIGDDLMEGEMDREKVRICPGSCSSLRKEDKETKRGGTRRTMGLLSPTMSFSCSTNPLSTASSGLRS